MFGKSLLMISMKTSEFCFKTFSTAIVLVIALFILN